MRNRLYTDYILRLNLNSGKVEQNSNVFYKSHLIGSITTTVEIAAIHLIGSITTTVEIAAIGIRFDL